MNTILKVLVGSRAHGLADENSDHDHRAVFVHRTSDLLKIRTRTTPLLKDTSWVENPEEGRDDTAWELGKFLGMAVHCNPTVLEVFAAPTVAATKDGVLLQSLFEHVWHPTRVKDAFVGYAANQRKKMLDGFSPESWKERSKYAAALVRSLVQAEMLLRRGILPVNFRPHPQYDFLCRIRKGEFKLGEVIEFFEAARQEVEKAHGSCDHEPDIDKVNDFLLRVRKENW